MFTLLSEVHFWSLRDGTSIRDTDFGAFRYYEKKASPSSSSTSSSSDSLFTSGKKVYSEKRGIIWTPTNKRPYKLKDSVKELEDCLEHLRVVYHQWRDSSTVQIMFNSGVVVNILVNPATGDISEIIFDKYMVGKLLSEYVGDVVVTNTHALCSYNDNQVTLVYFTKPTLKKGTVKKWSTLESKLQVVELAGPSGRRLERKMSVNTNGDMVLIWWKCTRDEVYPWSPQVKDQDRANVHVYSINGTRTELLCYYRTEFDPLCVTFSQVQSNVIYSVEQKVSRKGEVTVESCTYEISKSRLQRTSVTCIPLQTHVCCLAFSNDDSKLLLGCIDGSLVLFDEGRGATHLVKASFIPTLVCWHPDNCLVMVANERSQIQCFDASLACVKMQLISEDVTPSTIIDLGAYFRHQPTLLHISWNKKADSLLCTSYAQTDGFLLLLFERGPLAVLRLVGGGGLAHDAQGPGFTADVLVSQYLNMGQVERAVNLLLSLNWEISGPLCLACLHLIVNHILRLPLTPEREVQLETALGSFHVPSQPLSHATEVEFGDPVRDLTRRFFHHLLRYRLFEKAFRLAIDLNEYDLFMDIHHYARNVGDSIMAAAALEKADQVSDCNSHSGSSECNCSQSSCSCSCDSSSSEDEANDDRRTECRPPTIPPPLPVITRTHTATRQKVKFSDTVTHITVPEDPPGLCESRLESANTVGLPPVYLPHRQNHRPGMALHPRLRQELTVPMSLYLTNKHTPLPPAEPQEEEQESGKIKVVHFGVV